MFGIGGPELIFIMVLALLIFGPKRLPQIGRTLGKGMAEFRRASTELQRAINTEIEEPAHRVPATAMVTAPAQSPVPMAPAPVGPELSAPAAAGEAAQTPLTAEATEPSQFQ